MDNEMDYYETRKDIDRYSNPIMVQKRAFKLLGKQAKIVLSPRKSKKYRIYNPLTNKYVDFGFFGMEDYTKHKDKERQRKFKLRNHRWANAPEYSAGFLSYYLLWS
jgi:hypothetical protein